MTRLHTHDLLLQVRDDRAGTRKTLCRNLTLSFNSGENWAILGPNGSGKTTLLHTLAGLRPADGGSVGLGERDISAWSHRDRAQQIGMLFQQQETVFPATVMETVLTGRHPHLSASLWQAMWQWEDAEDRRRAQAALAAVGLDGFAQRLVTTLSGGERRRVELATLLTQDPPICLLDEAASHLDLKHQVGMLALLASRAREADGLNVFVLHDINLATRFCDYGVLLFGDGSHHHGRLQEILDADALDRLYDCRFRRLTDDGHSIYIPA